MFTTLMHQSVVAMVISSERVNNGCHSTSMLDFNKQRKNKMTFLFWCNYHEEAIVIIIFNETKTKNISL